VSHDHGHDVGDLDLELFVGVVQALRYEDALGIQKEQNYSTLMQLLQLRKYLQRDRTDLTFFESATAHAESVKILASLHGGIAGKQEASIRSNEDVALGRDRLWHGSECADHIRYGLWAKSGLLLRADTHGVQNDDLRVSIAGLASALQSEHESFGLAHVGAKARLE